MVKPPLPDETATNQRGSDGQTGMMRPRTAPMKEVTRDDDGAGSRSGVFSTSWIAAGCSRVES